MRDDVETNQIGRLIDAGHPDLAAKAFRARWRYQALTRIALSIPFVGAAAFHWFR